MPQSIAVIDPSIVSKKKEKKQVDYRVGKKLKHVTRNIITCRKKGPMPQSENLWVHLA
jgi:hypothetical protein